MKTKKFSFIILFPVLLLYTGCASYYQVNQEFNQDFQSGKLENALKTLEKQPKKEEGKERFLYLVNKGMLLSLLNRFEESNQYLEQAYLFGEDYRRDYLREAASYFTNPQITTYPGEDHEHIILLYYKALNFLQMNMLNEALIECRRMNLRLLSLADKFPKSTQYKEDAFVQMLMGIIYDASFDYNNAFIAYRNAYRIYKDEYPKLFNIETPQQLKEDLLRSAYRMGFYEDFEFYKKEFGMEGYEYKQHDGGELVFFWNNGLGPVKSETSINFVAVPGGDGIVNFTNEELGLTFPIPIPSDEDKKSITDLKIIRVAFPKYIERPLFYKNASLEVNGKNKNLQLAESINSIAFKSLEQRMVREVGKSILRLALKQAAEAAARNENEGLGMALGIFNAFTEKADTRNWQTLPHSIYYSRVQLDTGENSITLNLIPENGEAQQQEFNYNVKRKGQTIFQSFTSLELENMPYNNLSY